MYELHVRHGLTSYTNIIGILEKSPVLKHALSRGSTPDPPFVFLIDPDIFKHILEYLNTDTFPLFFSEPDGFDFDLYQRVSQYAERFQLSELRNWIQRQNYLDVVRLVCEESIEEFRPGLPRLNVPANVRVKRHIVTHMLPVFVCPRRIPGHDVVEGEPLICGAQCLGQLRGRRMDDSYQMMPRRELITLKRRFVFNAALLKKSASKS
jgi:hypothetical protein